MNTSNFKKQLLKLKIINKKRNIQYGLILILLFSIIGFYITQNEKDLSPKQLNEIEKKEELPDYEVLVTGSFNMDANLSYAVPLLKFKITDSLPYLQIGSEKVIQLREYDSMIPSMIQLTKLLNDNLNLKNSKPYHFYNPYLSASESIDFIKTTKGKTERKQISGHRFNNEKDISYIELDSIDVRISYLLHYFLASIAEKEWQDTISTNGLMSGNTIENLVRAKNARILEVSPEYIVIEKTGHKTEINEILAQLEPYGVLQFVRSGRVAITKQVKELNSYLKEMDEAKRSKTEAIEVLN